MPLGGTGAAGRGGPCIGRRTRPPDRVGSVRNPTGARFAAAVATLSVCILLFAGDLSRSPLGAAEALAAPSPPTPEAAPGAKPPAKKLRASPERAARFIAAFGRRVVVILTDGSLAPESRDARLRSLLRQSFDFGLIARFALGPYWPTIDRKQGEEYQRLFGEFLLDLYAARFDRQTIKTFRVLDARPAGRRDVVVATRFERPDGPSVPAEWRVRLIKGQPRIIDVVVAGISMALTYRSEFVSFIERNGGALDRLIARLRRRAI